jgi:hypothetical protein
MFKSLLFLKKNNIIIFIRIMETYTLPNRTSLLLINMMLQFRLFFVSCTLMENKNNKTALFFAITILFSKYTKKSNTIEKKTPSKEGCFSVLCVLY